MGGQHYLASVLLCSYRSVVHAALLSCRHSHALIVIFLPFFAKRSSLSSLLFLSSSFVERFGSSLLDNYSGLSPTISCTLFPI